VHKRLDRVAQSGEAHWFDLVSADALFIDAEQSPREPRRGIPGACCSHSGGGPFFAALVAGGRAEEQGRLARAVMARLRVAARHRPCAIQIFALLGKRVL